ncbi:thioredoxin-1-like [Condylostylus longicornis]|uniref:thioredoxin-1-like n=1 Tax=Condylostylus longicornis TaxID=2530218 RepID=UPI00244DCE14|nr:thioredoxin-1-like [Condylostylus longicornis]XP_055379007.1 thioredoxin-1-like [Condylostylus longicornis]
MVDVKNSKDFQVKLGKVGSKLVVIDFYAKWCPPCKQISPLLDRLELDYKSKAVVLKVDVDKCVEIANKYKISAMPTFLFMKNEKIIGKFSGADPENLKNCFYKFTKV